MSYKDKDFLIVVEGLDGSGKTTYIEHLAEFLKSHGINCIVSKEPTNLLIGQFIRKQLQNKELDFSQSTFQHLYAADRSYHRDKVIQPAIEQKKWIILDRYFFSSIAFGHASGVDFDLLNQINQEFIAPDLTIFIDTDVKTCMERITKRSGSDKKEFFEREEILAKVKISYEKIIKNYQQLISIHPRTPAIDRPLIINGNLSIEQVFNQSINTIKKLI